MRRALEGGKTIEDTHVFAEAHGFTHADLVGVCKSLSTGEFVVAENLSRCERQYFSDLASLAWSRPLTHLPCPAGKPCS